MSQETNPLHYLGKTYRSDSSSDTMGDFYYYVSAVGASKVKVLRLRKDPFEGNGGASDLKDAWYVMALSHTYHEFAKRLKCWKEVKANSRAKLGFVSLLDCQDELPNTIDQEVCSHTFSTHLWEFEPIQLPQESTKLGEDELSQARLKALGNAQPTDLLVGAFKQEGNLLFVLGDEIGGMQKCVCFTPQGITSGRFNADYLAKLDAYNEAPPWNSLIFAQAELADFVKLDVDYNVPMREEFSRGSEYWQNFVRWNQDMKRNKQIAAGNAKAFTGQPTLAQLNVVGSQWSIKFGATPARLNVSTGPDHYGNPVMLQISSPKPSIDTLDTLSKVSIQSFSTLTVSDVAEALVLARSLKRLGKRIYYEIPAIAESSSGTKLRKWNEFVNQWEKRTAPKTEYAGLEEGFVAGHVYDYRERLMVCCSVYAESADFIDVEDSAPLRKRFFVSQLHEFRRENCMSKSLIEKAMQISTLMIERQGFKFIPIHTPLYFRKVSNWLCQIQQFDQTDQVNSPALGTGSGSTITSNPCNEIEVLGRVSAPTGSTLTSEKLAAQVAADCYKKSSFSRLLDVEEAKGSFHMSYFDGLKMKPLVQKKGGSAYETVKRPRKFFGWLFPKSVVVSISSTEDPLA